MNRSKILLPFIVIIDLITVVCFQYQTNDEKSINTLKENFLKLPDAARPGNNQIDIEVANLWPNRLIGDEQFSDDGIKNNGWPDWFLNKQPRTSGRYTFTTAKFYKKDSKLLKSGLIGPVQLLKKTRWL